MTTTTPTAPKAAVRTTGAFCWNELHTRDTKRAVDFYTKVVGWTVKECGPAGAHDYSEWVTKSGVNAGGMMALPAEVPAHVPANWSVYINVEDVDAMAAKAVKLGGSKVRDPMDVPNVGRFCMIQDPTGAVFSLFKGIGDCGKKPQQPGSGEFCWTELMTKDAAASERFYTQLFGWTTTKMPMGDFEYTLYWLPGADKAAKTGGVGGMMTITEHMGNCPSHWLSYIAVDDVDGATAKVVPNGGKVCCPPTDIPNIGRFSVITDPTGATVAFFKNN